MCSRHEHQNEMRPVSDVCGANRTSYSSKRPSAARDSQAGSVSANQSPSRSFYFK